ncbi:MAG: hypothetical protein Q4C70_08730 [Planctomycetia bacterium]|nr:hypothetical protein [Planctomycetia bacterium]
MAIPKRWRCVFAWLVVCGMIFLSESVLIANDARVYWENFDENVRDFNEVKDLLKSMNVHSNFVNYTVITESNGHKIPFNELTANQGRKGKDWYSGCAYIVVPSQESLDFYDNVIYPKLSNFFKGIVSDPSNFQVRNITYEAVKRPFDDHLYLISHELEEMLDEKENSLIVLRKSASSKKLARMKEGDTITLESAIIVLPEAYASSVPSKNESLSVKLNLLTQSTSNRKEDVFFVKQYEILRRFVEYVDHDSWHGRLISGSSWANQYITVDPIFVPEDKESMVKGFTLTRNRASQALYHDEYVPSVKREDVSAEEWETIQQEESEKSEMEHKKWREEEFKKTPQSVRTFGFLYGIVVCTASIAFVGLTIYGLISNLHPSWYLFPGVAIWNAIIILYLGLFTGLVGFWICYQVSPWGSIITGGIFFLPFAIFHGMFNRSEEERRQDRMRDMIDEIRSPGSSLGNSLLRFGVKCIFIVLFGAVLLHVYWWCRIFLYTREILRLMRGINSVE